MINFVIWWPFCFRRPFFFRKKLRRVNMSFHAKFRASSSKIDRVMALALKVAPSPPVTSSMIELRVFAPAKNELVMLNLVFGFSLAELSLASVFSQAEFGRRCSTMQN